MMDSAREEILVIILEWVRERKIMLSNQSIDDLVDKFADYVEFNW